MNSERFNELRKEIIKRSFSIADAKGKDYTNGNTDILKHFKEGGKDFDIPTEKYLGIMLKKQMNAVYNYIKTNGQSESEPIEQRISDSINYLIFLEALIMETREQGDVQ
jgi:hypothetical protein